MNATSTSTQPAAAPPATTTQTPVAAATSPTPPTSPTPETAPTTAKPAAAPRLKNTLDFHNAKWSDVFEDDEGKAQGLFGVPFNAISSKKIRTMCSRLSIKGVKNKTKSEMIEKLVEVYEKRKPKKRNAASADIASVLVTLLDNNGNNNSSTSVGGESATLSGSVSASNKKQRLGNEIADAIHDHDNLQIKLELAKQELYCMQKEDDRREVEHTLQRNKNLFDEWERVQSKIRSLRRELRAESLDDEEKEELKEDITGLVKRKYDLSVLLGFK